MTVLRIAQAQSPVYTDKEQINDFLLRISEQSAQKGAHLLALPEMFCCPYDIASFPDYAGENYLDMTVNSLYPDKTPD